jgi:hypothetical protein
LHPRLLPQALPGGLVGYSAVAVATGSTYTAVAITASDVIVVIGAATRFAGADSS